jgi:hypothetical protein
VSNQEYNSAFQLEKYHRVMKGLRAQLGGECVRCKSVEDLEFDHIDPSTKLYTLSQIWSRPELVQDEIVKCQLLCRSCHIDKTLENGDNGTQRARHGTEYMYRTYKCRCEPCKLAFKEAQQRSAQANAEHGTVRMYSQGGCRCKLCSEAKRKSR